MWLPVTTAIFATCGMNIFIFILAALLSMPKQFIAERNEGDVEDLYID